MRRASVFGQKQTPKKIDYCLPFEGSGFNR